MPQKSSEPTENASAPPPKLKPTINPGSNAVTQPSTGSKTSVPNSVTIAPLSRALNTSAPNGVPSDRQPSNLIRSDSDLKNEIVAQFQTKLPRNHLIVEVSNGNVSVSGTVTTPEQLQQIQPLLSSIKGVEKIKIEVTTDPLKIQ